MPELQLHTSPPVTLKANTINSADTDRTGTTIGQAVNHSMVQEVMATPSPTTPGLSTITHLQISNMVDSHNTTCPAMAGTNMKVCIIHTIQM